MDWLRLALQQKILIPAAVFVAFIVVVLWLRRHAYRTIEKWAARTTWPGADLLINVTRTPSLLATLIIGLFLALEVSTVAHDFKVVAARALWSLFIIAAAFAASRLARGLAQLYLQRFELSPRAIALSSNTAVAAILVVAFLMVLDIWGAPTGPIVLLIGIAAVATLFALREGLASLFAGVQLAASRQIKEGDYIKLETGEEGYVTQITWRNTQLEALDTSAIIIPNHKLVQVRIVNLGHPLKQALEPFRFYTRFNMKELTNLKARNLRELAGILKTAPDSVVYYHTHHFLEEHHYLTPEPASDFAIWVEDALGNEILGERLASLDTFEFPTVTALRDRIVGVIEEYLARTPDSREALPGREFHFIRSISVILPLPYVAHDLREFVEVLRTVSLGSLYFHVFESRLRLGKGLNDFSIWMRDSLTEPDLANKIAGLDPYNYTLEGLRSSLIQFIEKRIK